MSVLVGYVVRLRSSKVITIAVSSVCDFSQGLEVLGIHR